MAAPTVPTITSPTSGATITAAFQLTAGGSTIPNDAPTCAIVAPVAAASLTAGDSMTISVQATDADGFVDSVEIFQNDVSLGLATFNSTDDRWDLVRTVPAEGAYTLHAIATDNDSAQTTSADVTFDAVAPTGATIHFRDDLTEATNGVLLADHTPTWGGAAGTGTGWTIISGTPEIWSDEIGSPGKARTNEAADGDFEIEVVCRRETTSANDFFLYFGSNAAMTESYVIYTYPDAWHIRKYLASTGTSLNTLTGSPGSYSDVWAAGTTRTIIFKRVGNQITVTIDGTTVWDLEDSTDPVATVGGHAGINCNASISSGPHLSSVIIRDAV